MNTTIPQVGQVYRSTVGDQSVRIVVTRVANGKVSFRANGGRQRTFSVAGFLSDVELVPTEERS